MPVGDAVSLISILISLTSLALVLFQLREQLAQRRLESEIRIYDVNRELIALGFARPELFDILRDAPDVDPETERRYLQLWINQLSLIHSTHRRGGLSRELESALVRSARDFMTLANMRRHWRLQRPFHPAPFREFVDEVVRGIESEAESGGPAP